MEWPPAPADVPHARGGERETRALGPERHLALAHAGPARPWLAAALELDDRLAELARRPGEATLGRLRLAWWEEAVRGLSDGPRPADPLLAALRPPVLDRPERADRIAALIEGWDGTIGTSEETQERDARLARAVADLLLDGAGHPPAATALRGWAAWRHGLVGTTQARAWLTEGLASSWPVALTGQRLLARAALHRLDGGGERMLALKLLGWAVARR